MPGLNVSRVTKEAVSEDSLFKKLLTMSWAKRAEKGDIPPIKNLDGSGSSLRSTSSSHSSTNAAGDTVHTVFLYPTIRNVNGKLKPLSRKKAFELADKNRDLFEVGSTKDVKELGGLDSLATALSNRLSSHLGGK